MRALKSVMGMAPRPPKPDFRPGSFEEAYLMARSRNSSLPEIPLSEEDLREAVMALATEVKDLRYHWS
ncbi:MAG: hypothetical protein BWY99_02539 [Synergistetes bacterium ADurb.BinA166]|nr:MAG: hypothetical protein BWY99_02539 [Synergistetes bacterium ADurb.BinA166]